MTFQISECTTNNMVTASCTTTWTFGSISGTQISPPNPWTWSVPTNGYGTYSASINCAGYAPQTTSFTITNSTTLVNLCVNRLNIPITVTECGQTLPLAVASTVQITATSLAYSSSVTVPASSSYSWTVPGFASFTFVTIASGYTNSTSTISVNSATTGINLCVKRPSIPIFVVDCNTNAAIASTATVAVAGVSQTYSTSLTVTSGSSASWTIPGYGDFSFSTSATGYTSKTETRTVSASTTSLTLCLSPSSVLVDIRNRATNTSIEVGASVTYTGVVSGSFRWAGIYTWIHGGYGQYSFVATPDSKYSTGNASVSLTSSVSLIIIYVDLPTVQIDVRNRVTNVSIEVPATVTYSGASSGSFRWTGIYTWQSAGYGQYAFSATPDSKYTTGSTSVSVTSTVSLIIIYVDTPTVQIDVRNNATNASIEVPATVTYSGISSGSFRWTGIYTWKTGGYGQYSFIATPDSKYTTGNLSMTVTSSTTLIIIYVSTAIICGDGLCNGGETFDTCTLDCVALFLEFENADGSGPVNGPTVNYFTQNPRDLNNATGPNRNSIQPDTTRTTGTGSNTVLETTYSYNQLVFFEVVVSSFINFYWVANTSNVDHSLGTYRLRVHLSKTLGTTDFNYRVVNTWRPIDDQPAPYSPTDLNLHLFHPSGALDINNPSLLSGGFQIGKAIADSKQSGGPATMDISPSSGVMVAIWNSKPPRNSAIAPSQNNRYLVDSGSYVVIYGKTSNAANGKQLGQVILDQLISNNPSIKLDHTSDLWYVAHVTINQPAVDQPTVVSIGELKPATITSTKDMIFDCEAYAYCVQFKVPFSDTGRRRRRDTDDHTEIDVF